MNGKPLRLLNNTFPDRQWVLRAVEIGERLYAILWHRFTDTTLQVPWTNKTTFMVPNPHHEFITMIRKIVHDDIFSRADNGFYYSHEWFRCRGVRPPFLVESDEVNGGFESVEAMRYAMKDDGYIYEGPEYPPAPMTPLWRNIDAWRDDEDAIGGWGLLVRMYEDCR